MPAMQADRFVETPPTHKGWLAFVPIWAWDDGSGCGLAPRWGLPHLLIDIAAGWQILLCDLAGTDRFFSLALSDVTEADVARWWRRIRREPLRENVCDRASQRRDA